MSWVTIIWAMIASACLTLALVHVLVWWHRREAPANLLFAVTAVATAVFAGFELWIMRAETPVAFGTAVRWGHAPIWVVFVSLVGFVRLYLRAGRLWLAWGDQVQLQQVLLNLWRQRTTPSRSSSAPPSTWRACRTLAQRASCSTCSCRDSTGSPSNGSSRRKAEQRGRPRDHRAPRALPQGTIYSFAAAWDKTRQH